MASEVLVKPRGPFGRSLNAFHTGPVTVRNALRVIVAATVTTTAAGGLLVWIFDRKDFSNLGDAMWWSLQTVTTVGYGDVTPTNAAGRLIGAVVLLYAVAFLTILTAAITTSFMERTRVLRDPAAAADMASVLDRLDDLAARFDRLERSLSVGDDADKATPTADPDLGGSGEGPHSVLPPSP